MKREETQTTKDIHVGAADPNQKCFRFVVIMDGRSSAYRYDQKCDGDPHHDVGLLHFVNAMFTLY
jgi:hypothetical protein